jgi:hypothetical protein
VGGCDCLPGLILAWQQVQCRVLPAAIAWLVLAVQISRPRHNTQRHTHLRGGGLSARGGVRLLLLLRLLRRGGDLLRL